MYEMIKGLKEPKHPLSDEIDMVEEERKTSKDLEQTKGDKDIGKQHLNDECVIVAEKGIEVCGTKEKFEGKADIEQNPHTEADIEKECNLKLALHIFGLLSKG